jgi:uncharacterized paraquat-inducible protein A
MKSFHNIRCEVCNKFITAEDVLDDGMCEKCADRLRRKLSERLRAWRVISAALTVSVVILAWRVLG